MSKQARGQTQSIDDHMECPVTFFLTVIWAKIIFLNTLFSILYEPHFPFSMNCAQFMLESTRMEKLFLTPSLTLTPTHPPLTKGRAASPKVMNFWKSSKRPLTPLIFGKSCCAFRDKIATKVRMFSMAGLLCII